MNSCDEISERVRTAYDQIAPTYASCNQEMVRELLVVAQKIVNHVGPNGHILEIGCGTGRDASWFERQGIQVTGVDLSMGMLKLARKIFRGNLVQLDMRQLPFGDGEFNGAWCCASLLHLPKNESKQVLQEIRRVLKGDSMLMLAIQEGDFEGWEGGYVENVKRFFARYGQGEMGELLVNAGYRVQEITKSEAGKRTWLQFVCVT